MRKALSLLLYRVYTAVLGSSIPKHLKQIKYADENRLVVKDEMLQNCLRRFGYDFANWYKLPLTGKKDISERLKDVDQRKIHSYSYTGGSYGEPFKIPYSKDRAHLRTATFAYFNQIAGYSLGEPFLLIAAKEKPAWWQLLRNEYRFVPRDLSDRRITEIVEVLIKEKIKVIIGFPSVVYELAVFIVKNNISLSVKAIIFTSEPSDEQRRLFIKDAFACRVTDRYSNEEVGLIAQQKEFGGVYYTNPYNILVEILDGNNKPVKEGEAGKVVLTDLMADLVPIIRYDTGDIAVAHEYKDGKLFSLRSISGRTTEQIFNAEGTPIAALALGPLIHKPLTEKNFYNQFQFAQVGRARYELRIKATDIPELILQDIEARLKAVLGQGAEITIRLLDDIVAQKSGKRPIYKNESNSNLSK